MEAWPACKGVEHPYCSEVVTDCFQRLGLARFFARFDIEPAILALLRTPAAEAAQGHGITGVIDPASKGDPNSNSLGELVAREIKAKIRVVISTVVDAYPGTMTPSAVLSELQLLFPDSEFPSLAACWPSTLACD